MPRPLVWGGALKQDRPRFFNNLVRAQMHTFVNSIFWISTAGFVATWFVGVCFWVCMFAVRKQHGRFRWQEVSLRGQLASSHPAARYMRGFMWSLLVASVWWCLGLASGLSSGILH